MNSRLFSEVNSCFTGLIPPCCAPWGFLSDEHIDQPSPNPHLRKPGDCFRQQQPDSNVLLWVLRFLPWSKSTPTSMCAVFVGLLCNDSKLRDCRWWWAACFRDFTRSWLPVFCKKSVAVCHYQDDVEACKSVHVVGYANPNPTELFRLATLFITGHLVFFGSVPYLQHEEIFGIVSSYCNPLCWDMVGWKRFRANNTTKTNASTSQASWVLWKTSPTRLSPSLPVITK